MCTVEAYRYICVFGAKRGKRLDEASYTYYLYASTVHKYCIYIYIYIRLKIKPNSVRIRF